MTDNLKLTAAADRSLAWAEGDSVRYVVATIGASAPTKKGNQPAPPIHLALVIDVSGSMAGEKLESAKAAALGVADRLRDSDRLSIVSFASDVLVHAKAMKLTIELRASIRAAIGGLDTRGCTNLSEGWFAGAECVANAIEADGANRVILLSDGAANEGITDTEQLALHATQLSKGGVTTSCVGVGDGYETPVLQAIAEHGGGRLHDAELGAEIVDALMGELSEIDDLAAKNVSVTLHVPATAKAAFVGSAPVTVGAGSLSVFSGALLQGRPRSFVFRVTLPANKVDETLLFGVTARGSDVTGGNLETLPVEVSFTFVEGSRNNRQPRDEAASMAVARAWHSEIIRVAARMNRAGDRRQARQFVEREIQFFERYCAGLAEARELLKEIAVLKQNVDRDWNERTRKEMEIASYLSESNRADYRALKRPWSDRLNEEG